MKRNQSVAEYCFVVQCSRYGKSGEFVLSRVKRSRTEQKGKESKDFFSVRCFTMRRTPT